MKHFGSYLTIAGAVPYVIYKLINSIYGENLGCVLLVHKWHSPCNSEVTSEMFHRIFALTPKNLYTLLRLKEKYWSYRAQLQCI